MFIVQRNHPRQPNIWTTVQGSARETQKECEDLIPTLGGPFQFAVIPVPEPVQLAPPSE